MALVFGASDRCFDRSDPGGGFFRLPRSVTANVQLRNYSQFFFRGQSLETSDAQDLGCSVLAVHSHYCRRVVDVQAGSPTGSGLAEIILSSRYRALLSAPFHVLASGFQAGLFTLLSFIDADRRVAFDRMREVGRNQDRIADLYFSSPRSLLAGGLHRQSASAAGKKKSKERAG